MTKISQYSLDNNISGNDKWIGSDAQNYLMTKNFTPNKVASYFNENNVIDIGTSVRYRYQTLDPGETRGQGTISFVTEIGPQVNFSDITTFLIAKNTLKGNTVTNYLNFLVGGKVILSRASNINVFGYYKITSIDVYIPNNNFLVVTVEFLSGNGFIYEDLDYLISLVDKVESSTSVIWGDISGDVNNQTDLINYLGSTYTPKSRELTINGVTYDLSADRQWTIDVPTLTSQLINDVPFLTQDNVLEYDDLASFPVTGVIGTIYIALDTGFFYSWDGVDYVLSSPTNTGITGVGRTDYIPKWTSPTTIGNSGFREVALETGARYTYGSQYIEFCRSGSALNLVRAQSNLLTTLGVAASFATKVYSSQAQEGIDYQSVGDFAISSGGLTFTPTTRFFIDRTTGFIYIGDGRVAASDRLHVGGNLRVTGAIKDSANAPGTSGQLLSSTATGTEWIDAPSGTTPTLQEVTDVGASTTKDIDAKSIFSYDGLPNQFGGFNNVGFFIGNLTDPSINSSIELNKIMNNFINYPLPTGVSSPIATLDDIPTKTSDLINDGDNGTSHFISLEDLPSTLTLYPTTTASGIGGYNRLVTSITDPVYNTTAVDVSTGAITGTDQLIAGLITDAGLIIGNPGIFNMTTIGNIRKTAGSGKAEFYFRVYKRDSGGTETLILQSSNTPPVDSAIYVEFNASGLWNDGIFISTDRIVLKFYATKVGGGSNPTYDFQFGGTQPVRSIVPVPLNVLPVLSLDELTDVTISTPVNNNLLAYESSTSLWKNKTIIEDAIVDGVTDKAPSQNAVFDALFTKFTLPALTNGSVLFSDGTTIAQDNDNFFWDDTNNRLAIGTTSPSAKITIRTDGTVVTTTENTGLFLENTTEATVGVTRQFSPSIVFSGNAWKIAGPASSHNIKYKLELQPFSTISAAEGKLNFMVNRNGAGWTDTGVYLYTDRFGSTTLFATSISVVGLTGLAGLVITKANPYNSNETLVVGGTNYLLSTGTNNGVSVTLGIAPTSGTHSYNGFSFTGIINQTGGANGITRGLYINPTLTSAFDFRAIEVVLGKIVFSATNTASGTTGAQTINKISGKVNAAAGTTSLVVTNNLVTAESIVMCQLGTNDATCVIKSVVEAAGSFTINYIAPTAETVIKFTTIN